MNFHHDKFLCSKFYFFFVFCLENKYQILLELNRQDAFNLLRLFANSLWVAYKNSHNFLKNNTLGGSLYWELIDVRACSRNLGKDFKGFISRCRLVVLEPWCETSAPSPTEIWAWLSSKRAATPASFKLRLSQERGLGWPSEKSSTPSSTKPSEVLDSILRYCFLT